MEDQEPKQYYYDIEYTLKGKDIPEHRFGISCGVNEMDALRNFSSDYLPSMGIIVAMRVVGLSGDGWNNGEVPRNCEKEVRENPALAWLFQRAN